MALRTREYKNVRGNKARAKRSVIDGSLKMHHIDFFTKLLSGWNRIYYDLRFSVPPEVLKALYLEQNFKHRDQQCGSALVDFCRWH